MKKLVLDTNVRISCLQTPEEFAERFAGFDLILLPSVVLGEYRAGLFDTKAGRASRKAIDEFLKNPAVRMCPLTNHTALVYAQVFQFLRKAGKPIPTNDIWIAAAVQENGAALATDDGHFKWIPLLQIV